MICQTVVLSIIKYIKYTVTASRDFQGEVNEFSTFPKTLYAGEMIIPKDFSDILYDKTYGHKEKVCHYCGSTSRVDDNGDCIKCGASNG